MSKTLLNFDNFPTRLTILLVFFVFVFGFIGFFVKSFQIYKKKNKLIKDFPNVTK